MNLRKIKLLGVCVVGVLVSFFETSAFTADFMALVERDSQWRQAIKVDLPRYTAEFCKKASNKNKVTNDAGQISAQVSSDREKAAVQGAISQMVKRFNEALSKKTETEEKEPKTEESRELLSSENKVVGIGQVRDQGKLSKIVGGNPNVRDYLAYPPASEMDFFLHPDDYSYERIERGSRFGGYYNQCGLRALNMDDDSMNRLYRRYPELFKAIQDTNGIEWQAVDAWQIIAEFLKKRIILYAYSSKSNSFLGVMAYGSEGYEVKREFLISEGLHGHYTEFRIYDKNGRRQ